MRPLLILPGWGFSPDCFQYSPGYKIPDVGYQSSWHQDPEPWVAYARMHAPMDCLAFSMGGLMLSQWLPDLAPYLHHIYLVGVAPCYPKKSITRFQKTMAKHPESVLSTFHQTCFHNAQEYRQFHTYFHTQCHAMWPKEALLAGLSVLTQSFQTSLLAEWPNLTLYHGQYDAIAPIQETRGLAAALNTELQLINTGHFPFLNTDFQHQLCRHRNTHV
ncbi:MAG: hypothetical protein P8L47_02480 [Candidatus Marinamargulisbacteria bacterium]|jgi:pimeloyl-ACP methyl ester carboxylesterase|nr:hypothetical protein [Candidatus Marinamargulisbacteria bacterium]